MTHHRILFDNCLIQAPDGVNLSRCHRRKLDWYLERGLGEIVSEDPLTLRLNFEPSGREGVDDPFVRSGKPNICIVCGTEEDLTYHHIVPYCFIRYMDLGWKFDMVRDIMGVCKRCHTKYEAIANIEKVRMSNEMGINVDGLPIVVSLDFKWAKGAANTLVKHRYKLPDNVIQTLIKRIEGFLEHEPSEEDIDNLSKRNRRDLECYIPFPKRILDDMGQEGLVKHWRSHFVKTMEPKFLPEEWSVDRKSYAWIPGRFKEEKMNQIIRDKVSEVESETAHLSITSDKKDHPVFQEIVAYKEAAIKPLYQILQEDEELQVFHTVWLALGTLIGFPEIPEESKGKIRDIRMAMLNHCNEKGLNE